MGVRMAVWVRGGVVGRWLRVVGAVVDGGLHGCGGCVVGRSLLLALGPHLVPQLLRTCHGRGGWLEGVGTVEE